MHQELTIALRVIGTVELLALVAVFFPRAWMARLHLWLGLGELPDAPIVSYLARSTSALYAVHGAALCYLSLDVVAYSEVIRLVSCTALLHGSVTFYLGWASRMPWWWVLSDALGVAFSGALPLTLQALSG